MCALMRIEDHTASPVMSASHLMGVLEAVFDQLIFVGCLTRIEYSKHMLSRSLALDLVEWDWILPFYSGTVSVYVNVIS